MSKTGDVNTCLFCTKQTSNEDKDCVSCHKKFHQSCIPTSTMTSQSNWKCDLCSNARKCDKSQRFRSTTSKSSVAASRNSALLLQKIAEEKKMQEETLAKELEIEQMKIALEEMNLTRQRAIDKAFIDKKYAVIAEGGSIRGSVSSEADEQERQKDITNWVQNQNRQENVNLNPMAVPFVHVPHAPPLLPQNHLNVDVGEHPRITREQLACRSFMGKLPTFSGDAKEWPIFISHYNRSTNICGFTSEENAVRLQNCLTGRARDVVGSMLSMPGCSEEVIDTLKQLFGKPEMILRELLNSVRLVKSLKEDDMKSLIDFSVKVNTICLTIQQGGLVDHLSNPCLVSELVQKLPSVLQMFWGSHKLTLPNERYMLPTFNKWLQTYFHIACDLEATSTANKTTEAKPAGKSKGYLNFHSEKSESPKSCIVCKKLCPTVDNCPVFKGCSVEDRWKCAKENRLCFSCLKRHIYWFCKERKVCDVNDCGKKHHRLLHEDPKEAPEVNLVAEVNVHQSQMKTLFRILPVKIYNKDRFVEVLAFIDEGSSTTLIEADVLSSIDAEGEVSPLCLKWTGEICRTEDDSKKLLGLQISAIHSSKKKFYLEMVRSVSRLELPAQELTEDQIGECEHTAHLPISPYAKGKPKLLLGLNNAHITATLKLSEGKLNEPIAAKTKIGWTLYGPSNNGSNESLNAHICDGDLHKLVKESFNLDSIGVIRSESSLMPSSEKKALDMLKAFTKRKENRFESCLLWRCSRAVLPDSFPMAKRRLECLEKRFSREPHLRTIMQKQIEEYEKKGYIEKLSANELNKAVDKVWYLPIFPVINPNKPGKVRMVWDAAASVKGVSLNSLLLKGPDQLASLIGVLFRFRELKVAVCGDIEQMFHRILMKRDDQDCQRFLWHNSGDEKMSVYRMTVLSFGAACSPCTAQFVKNENADQYSELYPDASEAIQKNHYVDDYLDSFASSETAIKIVKEVSFVHSKAGFHIRNWLSNSDQVIENIEGSSSESSKDINITEDGADKVLGMWWSTVSDSFTYSLQSQQCLSKSLKPTKREILRTLMKVFDPLGLISHVLVFAKVLLKKVWRLGLEWDQEITDDLFEMWQKWVDILQLIPSLRVPRWHLIVDYSTVQLHVFVDASRDAYGAAAYFRIKSNDETHCSLILAKSRVSPIKEVSIPRLELQGAVLGTRIARMIEDEHRLKISRTTFWTDAKTVLCWIRNSELRLKQFVSFRIGEILESTNVNQWRYVPSSSNVADKATKWVTTPDVQEDSVWFKGPDFLKKEEDEWPKDVTCTTEEEFVHIHTHCEDVSSHPIPFEKFSSWNRLLRGIAMAKRCVIRWKKGPVVSRNAFSSDELIKAEDTVFKLVQREVFPVEISDLIEKNQIQNTIKDSPLRKLCPFIDNEGVLRMYSRLSDGELDFNVRFPVILPKDHHVTRLVIHYFHIKYHHANKGTVINELRQKYQIPKIRVVVNSVRRACQLCKNNSAMPVPPLMASLIRPRMTTETRPFTFTGVDLFGPLFVIENRKTLKRWAMLFTCLTVRAVHIEVVHALSTDACILGIRRFMSIRGCPRQIYSDNGSNFRGASNEIKSFLRDLDKDKVQRTFNSTTTEWIFIPPAAPHMGGCWERMVQAVKKTLNKIMPDREPSDQMLLTMLAEACNVVNSRPLTYVPVDEGCPEAITPNHLLLGSSAGVKPMGTLVDDGDQLRRTWRYVELFANKFWKRFRLEYLPELCGRDKWTAKVDPIKVDDIVYIVDDASPRNEWPKGRVVEVYKGRNDQVRSCVVQTERGLYTRPAVRLAVLQVRSKLVPDNNVPGGTVGNSAAIVQEEEEENASCE